MKAIVFLRTIFSEDRHAFPVVNDIFFLFFFCTYADS